MPQNLKRKEHWTSKSLQRLRLAHRTNNANDKPLNEPAALGLLMDGYSMEEKTGRPSATSMLRNTGFKILSIMRFSNSSGINLRLLQLII